MSRLSSPGERKRNAVMANRVGVNMLQFYSVSNSLSHTTLSIKWEVYISKELYRSSLLCRRYDSACICIWVYNSSSYWKENIYIYVYELIGLQDRLITNSPGDLGSITGRVISKTPCLILSILRYVSRVKWRNRRKGVAPSPTLRCSSYWKWNLQVPLDYGRQLYILYLYIRVSSFLCIYVSDIDTKSYSHVTLSCYLLRFNPQLLSLML